MRSRLARAVVDFFARRPRSRTDPRGAGVRHYLGRRTRGREIRDFRSMERNTQRTSCGLKIRVSLVQFRPWAPRNRSFLVENQLSETPIAVGHVDDGLRQIRA